MRSIADGYLWRETPHPARTSSAPPSPTRGEGKNVLSPPIHRDSHPTFHLVRAQKLQRHALDVARAALALRHRDQEVTAVGYGDADSRMLRTIGDSEIIGPRSSGHIGDPDHLAHLERGKTLAHQIEIGDAVDLVVIGHAAIASAKADLRPHVQLYIFPAAPT